MNNTYDECNFNIMEPTLVGCSICEVNFTYLIDYYLFACYGKVSIFQPSYYGRNTANHRIPTPPPPPLNHLLTKAVLMAR